MAAGGDYPRPIPAERRRIDTSVVPAQDGQLLAGTVPQPGRSVTAGSQDALRIGAENSRIDKRAETLQDSRSLPVCVPQACRSVLARCYDPCAVLLAAR